MKTEKKEKENSKEKRKLIKEVIAEKGQTIEEAMIEEKRDDIGLEEKYEYKPSQHQPNLQSSQAMKGSMDESKKEKNISMNSDFDRITKDSKTEELILVESKRKEIPTSDVRVHLKSPLVISMVNNVDFISGGERPSLLLPNGFFKDNIVTMLRPFFVDNDRVMSFRPYGVNDIGEFTSIAEFKLKFIELEDRVLRYYDGMVRGIKDMFSEICGKRIPTTTSSSFDYLSVIQKSQMQDWNEFYDALFSTHVEGMELYDRITVFADNHELVLQNALENLLQNSCVDIDRFVQFIQTGDVDRVTFHPNVTDQNYIRGLYFFFHATNRRCLSYIAHRNPSIKRYICDVVLSMVQTINVVMTSSNDLVVNLESIVNKSLLSKTNINSLISELSSPDGYRAFFSLLTTMLCGNYCQIELKAVPSGWTPSYFIASILIMALIPSYVFTASSRRRMHNYVLYYYMYSLHRNGLAAYNQVIQTNISTLIDFREQLENYGGWTAFERAFLLSEHWAETAVQENFDPPIHSDQFINNRAIFMRPMSQAPRDRDAIVNTARWQELTNMVNEWNQGVIIGASDVQTNRSTTIILRQLTMNSTRIMSLISYIDSTLRTFAYMPIMNPYHGEHDFIRHTFILEPTAFFAMFMLVQPGSMVFPTVDVRMMSHCYRLEEFFELWTFNYFRINRALVDFPNYYKRKEKFRYALSLVPDFLNLKEIITNTLIDITPSDFILFPPDDEYEIYIPAICRERLEFVRNFINLRPSWFGYVNSFLWTASNTLIDEPDNSPFRYRDNIPPTSSYINPENILHTLRNGTHSTFFRDMYQQVSADGGTIEFHLPIRFSFDYSLNMELGNDPPFKLIASGSANEDVIKLDKVHIRRILRDHRHNILHMSSEYSRDSRWYCNVTETEYRGYDSIMQIMHEKQHISKFAKEFFPTQLVQHFIAS